MYSQLQINKYYIRNNQLNKINANILNREIYIFTNELLAR